MFLNFGHFQPCVLIKKVLIKSVWQNVFYVYESPVNFVTTLGKFEKELIFSCSV